MLYRQLCRSLDDGRTAASSWVGGDFPDVTLAPAEHSVQCSIFQCCEQHNLKSVKSNLVQHTIVHRSVGLDGAEEHYEICSATELVAVVIIVSLFHLVFELIKYPPLYTILASVFF